MYEQKAANADGGYATGRRWRWWYEGLADWLLANPDKTLTAAAQHFNKSLSAISMIRNSDAFRTYFEARKNEFRSRHDEILRGKLTQVATSGLDIILQHMEKKKDAVPLSLATNVTQSALDRLGFAPKAVAPATNVTVNNVAAPVHVSISIEALEEARAALRVVEQKRGEAGLLSAPAESELQRELIDASTPE